MGSWSFKTMRLTLDIALAILLPVALAGHDRTAIGQEEKWYDWGVVYFMSYDNNLETHGRTIIERIGAGISSERTIAAVQADFRDRGGMRRYTIRSSGIEVTRVDSENSASEHRFLDYLTWF